MTLTARPSTSGTSKDGAASRLVAVAAPMFGGELPVRLAAFLEAFIAPDMHMRPEVARVWRLHLVGGALAFEEGRMGVDQILMTRRTADGRGELPAVRHL